MESENLYNRLPKYWIYGSFAVAMLLDFIPLPSHLFHWLPEFTAMMLMYWLINRPQRVDLGTAFVVGVLVDIGTAAPLGQHALSYLLAPLRHSGNCRFFRLIVQRSGLNAGAFALHP